MSEVLLRSKEDILPLIRSAFDIESRSIEIGITRTEKRLRGVETKYGMKSEEFYQKVENGELKDSLDFIEWAGEIETLKRLKDDLVRLREIEICT
ncbi:MAG: hypothetical protein V2A53_10550 [bacterium]